MSTPLVPPVAPKKRGCLFYGCISLALAFVLVMILGYVGFQYARKSVRNLVENYTDAQPVAVDTVELPKEEAAELQKRVTAFQQALDRQERQEELVLSEHELNALIAQNQNLKGKVQAHIEGDRVRGRISWPLEDIGPIKLNGRYLNGLATFGVGLTNGQLSITVDDVQCKKERRSLPGRRFDPYSPAVAFDDFLAERQTQACAGVFVACVQTLEDDENPLKVGWLDADAIVSHRKNPFWLRRTLAGAGANMNARLFSSAKLQGIGDQVL